MHPNLNFGIKVLRDSGKKIVRYYDESVLFHSQTERGYYKASNTFLTEVSSKIHQSIERTFPDSLVIEHNTAKTLDFSTTDQDIWVYQPLCGFENFIKNIPLYCMTLVNFKGPLALHAIIYDPLRDEVYSASRGNGAQFNNRRLRVNKPQDIQTLFTQASNQNLPPALNNKQRILGSPSLELCFVSANRGEVALYEATQSKLELAAGKLIAREAGAACLETFLEGSQTKFLAIGHIDLLKKHFNFIKETSLT